MKTYTDIHGNKHSLTTQVLKGKDISRMEQMDKQVASKASAMAKDIKSDVFWCLKEIDTINRCFKQIQYFLIPIERSEIDKIISEFHNDYWIGIEYCKDIISETSSQSTMTGYDYEQECADYLANNGFTDVNVTQKSGDQGIDVIAFKGGLKYGFQCKYYKGTVPNKSVQEAYTGAKYYDCDVAVVMTTGTFSNATIELAHKIGVKLWTKS